MRKIIAALRVSLDGFIEGPNGELDWIQAWDDSFDLEPQIDACILGGGMYPNYEQYWLSILANPEGVLALSGKVATQGEIAYAQFADRTPHIVLSRTLAKADWKTTRIVRDVEDIRALKHLPGKDMYAVGGAALVGSLMNLGLIDELRLTVHPVVLGAGKALFKDVKERHSLTLLQTKTVMSGLVAVSYSVQAQDH
jgi:dihydrofolate reductase